MKLCRYGEKWGEEKKYLRSCPNARFVQTILLRRDRKREKEEKD